MDNCCTGKDRLKVRIRLAKPKIKVKKLTSSPRRARMTPLRPRHQETVDLNHLSPKPPPLVPFTTQLSRHQTTTSIIEKVVKPASAQKDRH